MLCSLAFERIHHTIGRLASRIVPDSADSDSTYENLHSDCSTDSTSMNNWLSFLTYSRFWLAAQKRYGYIEVTCDRWRLASLFGRNAAFCDLWVFSICSGGNMLIELFCASPAYFGLARVILNPSSSSARCRFKPVGRCGEGKDNQVNLNVQKSITVAKHLIVS